MELWHFAFLQSIELYSDRAAELVTELIFLSRTAQLSASANVPTSKFKFSV